MFKKEFYCTNVHWKARRPITFFVAFIGTLVCQREHGHISICIFFMTRELSESVIGKELTLVHMILVDIF